MSDTTFTPTSYPTGGTEDDGAGTETVISTTSATVQLTSFTAGDLVISISGDGDGSGTYTDNQASPITLEEITTTGDVVGDLVLPQTTEVVDGTTEYAISGEYGSSSEGSLQLSADGQSLVIAGYGVNAATFNAGGASVYGDSALGQSTSLTDTQFTPVPRVIADISYNGTVDTSTELYNVFNTNNPRSVATVDGTSFYVAGQGVKGDDTQGVFYAQDGASSATAINTSVDMRTAEIIDGVLYVSTDSKQGSGGTSNIASYGGLPTGSTTPTPLSGIDGTVTLTVGKDLGNGVNADGTTVHLSPENFFFANDTTLYVADGGNPKEGGLGDGGLQKWSLIDGTWQLDYTLAAGLNLVADTGTAGTTGLLGLTGVVVDGEVELYATNATIGDLDPTFVYAITDNLAATSATQVADEGFSVVMSAAPDTNIRGISFAPQAATATPTDFTVSSGVTSSGLSVASGGSATVLSGGTAEALTILSGGSATIAAGGTDSGTTIAHGGNETVLGSATGDVVQGTQLVSAAGADVSNETVYNGGAIDLFLKGSTGENITVTNGGGLYLNGNVVATDVTISSGGLVELQSPKANVSGTLTFSGAGTLEDTATMSAGFGVSAIISGFGAGDVIDLTTMGGSTLTTAVSGGNTVATVTNGSTVETFTFAGSALESQLKLSDDGQGGMEITAGAPVTSSSGVTVSSGSDAIGLTVSAGNPLTVQAGGTIINTVILSGGSAVVSGTDTNATISAGGNETILGSASGDQVYGTQLVSAATAVVTGETVYNGGAIELFLKAALGEDITVSSGGSLLLSGNVTAEDTVLMGGGLVELQSPKANVTGTLTFSGSATLRDTDTMSAGFGVSATISGFSAGDVIDLTTMSGATLTSTTSGGLTVESVTGNGVTDTFTFAGDYTNEFFQLSADSVGGVMLTVNGTPCYCPGTLILTDKGEVPVESLRVGDSVVTHAGAVRPIRWIGYRAYDGRFIAGQRQVLPVRIAAGALADGVPRRDLTVSPLHAMFIDGMLIPAAALVNGVSIVQLEAVDRVEYFHIELETHDVLMAEGAPAESFVDDQGRGIFHNAAEYDALYPDAVRKPAEYCAPRLEEGAALEAIRSRLATRAVPAASRGPLDGSIDVATRGQVAGWACDLLNPSDPVRLRVIANDVVLCEVVADQYRPDLAAAEIGDGRHAFSITIPGGLAPGAEHVIRVQRVTDGAALAERRCA